MKLTINGVEQAESKLKGETLEAILDMMVKNAPGSYIRRIWLDQQEFPADDRETLQKKLYSESVMYQICDHVKSLIILTIPMENQIYLFQKIQKNIPSSKSIQQSQSP